MKLLMDVQGFKILREAHPAVLHRRTLSGSHTSRLTEVGAGQKVTEPAFVYPMWGVRIGKLS